MGTENYDRPRLLKLLSEMGLEVQAEEEDFCEMTAAEMRTLIEQCYLELDDYASEHFQVDYFLGVMEQVGEITAYGTLCVGPSELTLDIVGLEVASADPNKSVDFLLATFGADEACRTESGAIRVWWD